MNLSKLRKRRNLTKALLAEQIGVTRDEITAWENGAPIPAHYVDGLAYVLKCTPEHIQEFNTITSEAPLCPTKIEPITCPICGKRELAFVSESHQCIKARMISILLLMVMALLLFSGLDDRSIVIASIVAFLFFLVKLYQYYVESKTHVQAICKECGHLWLLN